MSKYLVKNVKCGLTSVGMCADAVVAEVQLADAESGKAMYLSVVEVEDSPNIYKTGESIYERLVNQGVTDRERDELSAEEREERSDEFFEKLNADGVVYADEGYTAFFGDEEMGGELRDALRYLIYLTRSDWDEIDRFKGETVGKCIGDFEIPECDAERAFNCGVELYELYEMEDEG